MSFPANSLAFVYRVVAPNPKSARWALTPTMSLQCYGFPQVVAAASSSCAPLLPRRLSSSSRTLLSSMASSATPRRWQSALVQRRRFPLMVSNPPRVSRFHRELGNMSTISGVDRGDDDSGEPCRDERTDKDACRTTSEIVDTEGQIEKHLGCEEHPADQRAVSDDKKVTDDDEGRTVNGILAKSRHGDGSIYRSMDLWWKKSYCIANRNETRLEAKTLSEPAECLLHDGTCYKHTPSRMLQIFSIEVADISLDGGPVELYGYIAARDDIDPLLNYVVNFSRDDPIIVEQGSFINMTGPKRAMDMCDLIFIEFDMRIKTGEQEKDDLQLIDGVTTIFHVGAWNRPSSLCIPGDCGAVKIKFSRLEPAVEATVEILVSKVQSNFSLSLGCLTSELDTEIQLFNGAISESCGLKKYVVAVVYDSFIDLKFKFDSSEQRRCTFEAQSHGHDTEEIKTDFALLSVKVTWSTLPRGSLPEWLIKT